jgi:hypothetical protein
MLTAKKNEMTVVSDWHIWLVGGCGAALFDIAINNGKLLQMLTIFV